MLADEIQIGTTPKVLPTPTFPSAREVWDNRYAATICVHTILSTVGINEIARVYTAMHQKYGITPTLLFMTETGYREFTDPANIALVVRHRTWRNGTALGGYLGTLMGIELYTDTHVYPKFLPYSCML